MHDDRDTSYAIAETIARRAGSIKECEVHGGNLDNDCIEEAYKLGNALYEQEFRDVFSSRAEMADEIKRVVDDAAWECPDCHRD